MRLTLYATAGLLAITASSPAVADSTGGPGEFIAAAGAALDIAALDGYRAGADVKNTIRPDGTVAENTARNVVTGMNSVSEGAFTNASGLPIVIQNSGTNVLIQNATIVNIQLK